MTYGSIHKSRGLLRVFVFCAVIAFGAFLFSTVISKKTFAEDLKSVNYTLREGSIGSGSLNQSSSSSYRITDATGDIGIGNSASSNFNLSAGSKTPVDPTLSFAITNATTNFPTFSASSASMATATFRVLNYTSYGYIVQIQGTSPTNNGHTIPALSSTSTSSPGTEQFGINLVANTSPANIGANPSNGGYGFGQASPNYSTPNQFRFVSGETIASAPKSSGETNYTISYLVNVAGLTPGGIYNSDITLIVVGTY